MEKADLQKLTNEELLVRKKEMKSAKLFHASFLGFLGGILLFGLGAWILSPEKQPGFLVPMIIPVFLIYQLTKGPNKNKDLEEILKERGLD
jgi:hypothetical protein